MFQLVSKQERGKNRKIFSNLSSSKVVKDLVNHGIKMSLKCLFRMVIMCMINHTAGEVYSPSTISPGRKRTPTGVCTLKYSHSMFG